MLLTATDNGLITAWFFIRKQPWRLRYLPAETAEPTRAAAAVRGAAERLRDRGAVPFTTTIYEPKAHAFGGPAGMHAAHTLFHADSRHITAHLAAHASQPAGRSDTDVRRVKMSALLCTALMRRQPGPL